MKYINLLILIIIVSITSCRKNIEEFTPIYSCPVQKSQVRFSGQVFDVNNNPIENVKIFIEDSIFMTDDNGIFVTNSINTFFNEARLKFEKDGYFTGYKTITPHNEDNHQIKIILLSNENTGSFDNASGGTVEFEGGKISFPIESVAQYDGSSYSGTVNISAKYIDPTTQIGLLSMPGDLRATNNNLQTVTLKSFGMIAVELNDGAGNKLQIAEHKSATVEFEIPSELVGSAPNSIPLWYFDENSMVWKEEGFAELQGEKYIGEVRHFSFWNCDIDFDAIQFEMILKDQNQNPLEEILVELEVVSTGWKSYGWTSDEGWIGGLIPANEELILNLFFPNCGIGSDPFFSMNIGPFSSSTVFGDVTVNMPLVDIYIAYGVLKDCDGNPVSNGYISYFTDDYCGNNQMIVNLESDGSFNFQFFDYSDNANIILKGVDMTNLKESPVGYYDLSINTNLGDIIACEEVEEYLTFSSGITPTITFVEVDMQSWDGETTRVYGGDGQNALQFDFDGAAAGTYTLDLGLWSPEFAAPAYFLGTVTIGDYPEVGDYLEGTFEGEFTTGEPINGSFRVKREF